MSNPEIVKILLDLEKEDPEGKLRAEVVLEKARDPESPLHAEFNWDLHEAAERDLLLQARNLIRRYTIIVETPAGAGEVQQVKVKLFNSNDLDRKNGGGYRSVGSIISSREIFNSQLRTMRGEAITLKQKLVNFTMLRKVKFEKFAAAIDEFSADVDRELEASEDDEKDAAE